MAPNPGRALRSPRLVGALAGLALLAAVTAEASTHFGIISTVRTTPRTTARINLAMTFRDAIQFTVFTPDGSPLSDVLPFNAHLFASSADSAMPEIQNLFVGSQGSTGLVVAQATQSVSNATLVQSSVDGNVILDLPPIEEARAIWFFVPIGNLRQGTTLLVGNPNSQPAAYRVRYGESAPEPDAVVPAFGVAVVDVTRSDALLTLEALDATLPLIAQLAVDTGKTTIMTYLKGLPMD
jgi:hypothetical protein